MGFVFSSSLLAFLLKFTASSVTIVKDRLSPPFFSEQKTSLQILHVNSMKSELHFIFLSVFPHKLLFGFLEADAFLLLLAFCVCEVKEEDIFTKIMFLP